MVVVVESGVVNCPALKDSNYLENSKRLDRIKQAARK